MKNEIKNKLDFWLNSKVVEDADKKKIQQLLQEDTAELEDAFYKDLEFGTGGLRGVMGVGTNRMNKYTVGIATQGLANYLKLQFPKQSIKAVIDYDSRINSKYFADVSASVLSANGIEVFVFDDIRPTPQLSFALRELKCKAGIVITASHNPKEYNGYKVYWEDGGQLVSPHDVNIINEVKKIKSYDDVKFDADRSLIKTIGSEIDELYYKALLSVSINPEVIANNNALKIVYTPLHGTGYKILPEALKRYGYRNVILVKEQSIPDGNFPTVVSPNPEEIEGMAMALDLAKETQADLVMATDPDGDRLGVGYRDKNGEYILLNGNQTAAILTYYILENYHKLNRLNNNLMIVKTIVTSDILKNIADYYGVKTFEVLTGFKYIADIILRYEGKYKFLCGGEESYGFLIGDFVRDKDAVVTACMFAETTSWANSMGKNISDILEEIAVKFGLYREELLSVTKKGQSGMQEISSMMEEFRNNVPESVCGIKVKKLLDYKQLTNKNLQTQKTENIDLPSSNVVQYLLEDGSKITMRPSGTEPKIKFYISVKAQISKTEEYKRTFDSLGIKIQNIIEELLIVEL